MPTVQQLSDLITLTRNSELAKGSWVSLAAQLPGYLYTRNLLPRMVKKFAKQVEWPIEIQATSSYEKSYVNHPLQVAVPDLAKKARVDWAKVRVSTGWNVDEDELQGVADENQIVSVIEMRKKKNLDLDLIEGIEFDLARQSGVVTGTDNPPSIYSIPTWLPEKTTATDLELNGGADPTGFTSGIGNILKADVPRWGHAVCGYTAVSDADMFDKISRFMHTVKYLAPHNPPEAFPTSPDRCIHVQTEVFLAIERLQTTANENLKNDLGMFRGQANFRSIPIDIWHAISDADSPTKPTGYGVFYVLDYNSFKWITHSAFNFDLSPATLDPNVPGAIKQWRLGYCQLLCVNRERNLVGYTTNTDLF